LWPLSLDALVLTGRLAHRGWNSTFEPKAIGIGFLGGGVIFVDKSREHVLGLTTAASIWATAAIGIAAGLGHLVVAVGSAVILLIVLRGMARFERDDR
jgi:uncharacterized membrane protein YhiD involved in acid resistance